MGLTQTEVLGRILGIPKAHILGGPCLQGKSCSRGLILASPSTSPSRPFRYLFGHICAYSEPINTTNNPLPSPLLHFTTIAIAMFNSNSDPSPPHPPLTFSATPSPPTFSYASSLPSSYSLHSSFSPLPAHYIPDPFSSDPSPHHHHHRPSSPSSSSTSGDYPDFNSGPFRRVFSTGDLQGMNGSQPQVPSENCGQDGGAVAMRAARYTAAERKERIERYRSKRHQRNFHKKITYACRKTLADSRPRVRGRFVRGGDAETTEAAANCYESFSYDSYAHQRSECNFDNSGDGGSGGGRESQNSEEECCFLDEDLWVNFADVIPVNFLY